uniref:Uncharacterized protein n=1 Tax=Spongospora subterranea TaxID=70186 RepID=A0A0H5QFV0_9EUKA|eukprot:CRZ00933.1 hypothetical protein [Spongospora subterranea]
MNDTGENGGVVDGPKITEWRGAAATSKRPREESNVIPLKKMEKEFDLLDYGSGVEFVPTIEKSMAPRRPVNQECKNLTFGNRQNLSFDAVPMDTKDDKSCNQKMIFQGETDLAFRQNPEADGHLKVHSSNPLLECRSSPPAKFVKRSSASSTLMATAPLLQKPVPKQIAVGEQENSNELLPIPRQIFVSSTGGNNTSGTIDGQPILQQKIPEPCAELCVKPQKKEENVETGNSNQQEKIGTVKLTDPIIHGIEPKQQVSLLPLPLAASISPPVSEAAMQTCTHWLNEERSQALNQANLEFLRTKEIEESLSAQLERMLYETKQALQAEIEFSVRLCTVRGQCLLLRNPEFGNVELLAENAIKEILDMDREITS